jgi:hypothetical protein
LEFSNFSKAGEELSVLSCARSNCYPEALVCSYKWCPHLNETPPRLEQRRSKHRNALYRQPPQVGWKNSGPRYRIYWGPSLHQPGTRSPASSTFQISWKVDSKTVQEIPTKLGQCAPGPSTSFLVQPTTCNPTTQPAMHVHIARSTRLLIAIAISFSFFLAEISSKSTSMP